MKNESISRDDVPLATTSAASPEQNEFQQNLQVGIDVQLIKPVQGVTTRQQAQTTLPAASNTNTTVSTAFKN